MPRVFRITGKFRDRTGAWRRFTMEVLAFNDRDAVEKAYTRIGGNHKVPRKLIKIDEVKEVSVDEVEDRFIKQLANMDRIVTW